ncbi:MAG: hypothetical protein WBB27_02895, partial [Maribacter sp.]
MKKNKLPLFLIIIFFVACEKDITNDNLLDQALSSQHPNIKRVMDRLEQYEVQIRYTKIDRRNDS